MTRRKLKVWERDFLYRKSMGRCVNCGAKLKSGWHADHIKPFCITNRTNIFEMQSLCPTCNLQKGSKPNSLHTDRGDNMQHIEINTEGFRSAQKALFPKILADIKAGKNEIGIHLHIRGGKSMLIRMMALSLKESGLCEVSVAVNNRSELRRQIADVKELASDLGRVDVAVSDVKQRTEYPIISLAKFDAKGRELVGYLPDDIYTNNEYLLSATIQTICGKEKYLQWIEHMTSEGKRVVMFLDEAQEYGTDNSSANWGPFIKQCQQLGAIIVSLSGFPFREDGQIIPGFVPHGATAEEYEKWVLGKCIDEVERKYETHLMAGKKERFTLVPIGGDDYVYGLDKGFRSGALCKISCIEVDTSATITEGKKTLLDNDRISTASKSVSARILRKYVQDSIIIEHSVDMLLHHLDVMRSAEKGIKGIVFSLTDQFDGSDKINDRHAKEIKREILSQDNSLKVKIITGNTDDATDKLLNFKEDNVDIVILKNMGRVGFDCPRAKLMLDLSSIRSLSKCAQSWLRISTPYKDIAARLIVPADVSARENFAEIVTGNGGEMTRVSAESTKKGETILEDSDGVDLDVHKITDSDVWDVDSKRTDYRNLKIVEAFEKKYPLQSIGFKSMTIPEQVKFVMELMDGGLKLSIDIGEEEKFKESGREIAKKKSKIKDQINKLTSSMAGYSNYYEAAKYCDEKILHETYGKNWRACKRYAGVEPNTELKDIRSIPILDKMLEWLGYRVAA